MARNKGLHKKSIATFTGNYLEVKFWVDQQICPSCQKYLLVDVISHLKQLSQSHGGLRVDLFAEVMSHDGTNRVAVKRSTIWPLTVGKNSTFESLPDVYF